MRRLRRKPTGSSKTVQSARSAPITGETRLAAVIGSPVRHSLSPALHNAAFRAAGVDAVYLAVPVEAGRAPHAVAAMREFDWLGMSVTMPHKAAVIEACDRVTKIARDLGSVNCVFRDGNQVVGDCTDGDGWINGLADELDVGVSGAHVAIVGAGGAARAIVAALGAAGADRVSVINRTTERAELAVSAAPTIAQVGDQSTLAEADIVVNATPIGMANTASAHQVPFDVSILGEHAVVSDLVYHPRQTALIAAAAERGLRSQNGVAMLVHQAVAQFEHWTGVAAPVEVMRNAATAAIVG